MNGRLMLVMIARSRKAGDVSRDPRIVLQSPVTEPGDPGMVGVGRVGTAPG